MKLTYRKRMKHVVERVWQRVPKLGGRMMKRF